MNNGIASTGRIASLWPNTPLITNSGNKASARYCHQLTDSRRRT